MSLPLRQVQAIIIKDIIDICMLFESIYILEVCVMKYFVGIDLGGTNIKAGIVDEQGKIICKDRMKTNAARDQLAIVRDMALMAEKVIKQSGKNVSEIEAIGI